MENAAVLCAKAAQPWSTTVSSAAVFLWPIAPCSMLYMLFNIQQLLVTKSSPAVSKMW